MLTLLLACGAPSDEGDIAFTAPDGEGAWSAVSEEDSVDRDDGVTLTLQVWWPTDSDEGSAVEYDQVATGQALSRGRVVCDPRRPAVVFSHGHRGIRWQSFFLTEGLAEHGWVVIAPDHPGNTLFDPDGSDEDWARSAMSRPGDVSLAYDRLLARSADPDDELFGCVDESQGFLVAGHSFGGFTTVATAGAALDIAGLRESCAVEDAFWCGAEDFVGAEVDELDLSDDRVIGGLALAPGGAQAFGAHLAEIPVPMLIFGATLDEQTPYEEEAVVIYEGLTVEPRLAGLLEGGHFSFTELCVVPLDDFDGCSDEFLDIETAKRLTRTVSLAFAWELLGFEEARQWLPPEGEPDLLWQDGL
jgi:predicted dienelactone hydrolase